MIARGAAAAMMGRLFALVRRSLRWTWVDYASFALAGVMLYLFALGMIYGKDQKCSLGAFLLRQVCGWESTVR